MYLLKRNFAFIISCVLVFTLLAPALGAKAASASNAASAPVTVHQLKGNLNVNGIYYGSVELQLTAQDTGSGVSSTRYSLDEGETWLTYSQPVLFSDKKVYHIQYQSLGSDSSVESPKEVVFTIKKDNYPPETSIVVNGTQGQNSYYTSTVTVSLNATDAHSGIQYSEYSLNAGQNWNRYSTPVAVEGANTIIYYRSIDVDGNLEKTKKSKISVDMVPPSPPEFVISPDEWSNSTFMVTIKDGVDSQSGTFKSQYRVGNSNTWLEYTKPVEVQGDGLTTIYGRTLDFAGNSSATAEYTLQFDKIPPTAPVIGLSSTDWTNEPVYVSIKGGTDGESSILGYDYKIGNATEWSTYFNSFSVEKEGITSIYARSIDKAGNVGPSIESTIKIDLTAPVAPKNIFKVNQLGRTALIRWSSGSDSLSGMKEYEIMNGDELLGITQDHQIKLGNLRPNEKYSITIISVDNAGNISEESVPLVFFTSSISVSGYRDHTFAVNQQGQVWGWGLNNRGQLGDGTLTNRNAATRISALDGFSMISTGLTQNIGLRTDGTVWTWGQDYYGRALSLQKIEGLEEIVSISSGLAHFLALKEDGTVWVWGINGFGQLGTGDINNQLTPTQVPGLDAVVSVTGSYYNSMALREDGSVWVWGDGSKGILGYDAPAEYKQLVPVQIQGLSDIIQTDISYLHASALKRDGTVWTWGYNLNGQLGDGSTYDRSIPTKIQKLANIVKISSSYAHNLALTGDGKVWSWGDNAHGELGDGTVIQSRTVPVRAAHLEGIVDIEAAELHSFAVKSNGSVWSWGSNTYGQLGNGTTTAQITRSLVTGIDYPIDTQVPSAPSNLTSTGKTSMTVVLSWGESTDNHAVKEYLIYRGTNLIQSLVVDGKSMDDITGYTATGLSPNSTYTFSVKARDYAGNISASSNEISATTEASLPMAVSAGSNQTYALKTDGSVWSWGYNSNGQLGNGTLSASTSAKQTTILSSITAISAGGTFGLGLKSDGTVWGWGENSMGQLGNTALTSQQYTPKKIENFDFVVAISGGNTHSIALKSDGTVWTWGSNIYGELGIGSNTNKYVPTQVPSLTSVKAVSAGMFYSLALKTDGTVWAWGNNSYGQLGDGTTTNRLVPVKITTLAGVGSISAGLYHALALKQDKTVWAWGSNSNGQIGDGTTNSRMVPVKVSSLSGVIQISAGMYHSLAKNETAVYSWGSNASGQLGNNSSYNSSIPVLVSSISVTKDIEAGNNHNGVVTSNSVMTWGSNSGGQLGNGTLTNSPIPVNVNGLVAAKSASQNVQSNSGAVGTVKGMIYPDHFVIPDLIAPTAPSDVLVQLNQDILTLNWTASTDNLEVKEYWIYINEKVVLKTSLSEAVELQLPKEPVFSITVRAVDKAGNISGSSIPVSP